MVNISLTMDKALLFLSFRHRLSSKSYICVRNLSSPTSEEKVLVTADKDPQDHKDESAVEKIRNKSRLRPHTWNLLFDKKPYEEPVHKHHFTVKYNRKLYGKYGSVSEVNPGIMWPTEHDLEERKEYESVAYPYQIQEMVALAKAEIDRKENEKLELEKRIIENMSKLEQWKKQLRDSITKKEAEALAAKEKRDKLVEDVRRHFGFTVDPRDDRFKEMLALKEKEQKKKEKQARLEEREKRAIAWLMEKHQQNQSNKKTE